MKTSLWTGLKWPSDGGPKIKFKTVNVEPVALALASNAIPPISLDSLLPTIPEPTTAVRKKWCPEISQ